MRERTLIWTAALVLCTGLTALTCEHLQLAQPLVEGMRVLFGLTTTVAISTTLIAGARRLADQPAPELYRYTRLVSRRVYILVYVLGIVRISLYLFDVSHAQLGHNSHLPAVRPLDDFLFYVCCSIIPLWSVRALVLTIPVRELQLIVRRCVTQIVGSHRTPSVPAPVTKTHT
jgi:hypothetical protein